MFSNISGDKHEQDSDFVRVTVAQRANNACEYCLLPQIGAFHIDHIIPPMAWDRYVAGELEGVPFTPGRHGPDHVENYCWACPFCNLRKKNKVSGSIRGKTYSLFDPRYHKWNEHFGFRAKYGFRPNYAIIIPMSEIGWVTVQHLGVNDSHLGELSLMMARIDCINLGLYPPGWIRS
jgi:hypothetical protein